MKAQLYIGDELAQETVEISSPPREGDLVLFRDQRLRVREIGHHIEKKKLRIVCHVPPQKPVEAAEVVANHIDVDDFYRNEDTDVDE